MRRAFFEPISAPEILARRTQQSIEAICQALEGRGLGARVLDLVFERVYGRREAVRIGTSQPNRDPKRLGRLLCERLDKVDPGFGIEAMALPATLAEPLAPAQTVSSLDANEQRVDVGGLVDVFANRLGSDRVYRLAPVDSDLPERSVLPPRRR